MKFRYLILLIHVILLPKSSLSRTYQFKKCCPPDQVLSFRDFQCVSANSSDVTGTVKDFISPPFLSVVDPSSSGGADYYYYDEEEAPVITTPDFELKYSGFPKCGVDKELYAILYPDNNPEHADFIIDDVGIIVEDKSQVLYHIDEDTVHRDFCLDASFDWDLFKGTMTLVCNTHNDILCSDKSNKSCVSVCCPKRHYFDYNVGCQKSPDASIPNITFYQDTEDVDDAEEVEIDNTNTKYIYGSTPDCGGGEMHMYKDFKILKTSQVHAGGKRHKYNKFCVADFGEFDVNNTNWLNEMQPQVLVCAPKNPWEEGWLRWVQVVDFTIVPILFVISMIFLVLLFIFVWRRNRHKLFGVMTLCLISMLFCFYVFLITAKFSGAGIVKNFRALCILLGYLIQYSYLSAIFWLNAMSFDIWSTFRSMRRLPDPNAAQGWKHKRFKWYALWSWGGPFLVSLVTIIMQALPEDLTTGAITPRVGVDRCFLGDRWAMIVYLNIIILPLGIVNILFFVSSMWNLLCGVWADKSGDPALRAQHKSLYKTVIKMFFAMGITWFAEAISHALEWAYDPQDVKYIVLLFKIINSLQGFILFCVIVFDSAMIDLIKEKLCGIKPPDRRHKASVMYSSTAHSNANTRASKLSFSSANFQTSLRKISTNLMPERMKRKSQKKPSDEPAQPAEAIELKKSNSSIEEA